MDSESQNAASFIVLDSQNESQNYTPGKLFETLTALRGASDNAKTSHLPYSPRKCDMPSSGSSMKGPRKAVGGSSDGSSGQKGGEAPGGSNSAGPPGGVGGERGSGGCSGGGEGGGQQGGAGGGGGREPGRDDDNADDIIDDQEDEPMEETPPSTGSSTAVPALVRPVGGIEAEGEFAVPHPPNRSSSEERLNISGSEGGISDAPTAVVSDTEGHGQIIVNTRRQQHSTASPEVQQMINMSGESARDVSSAASTLSSLTSSSSGEAEDKEHHGRALTPRKRALAKRLESPKRGRRPLTRNKDPDVSTSNSGACNSPTKQKAECGEMTREQTSILDVSSTQDDMFADEDPDVTREASPEKGHPVTATPSETVASLHLSGGPVLVPETVDEDLIPPSLDAYESVPMMIPSTPTPDTPPVEPRAGRKSSSPRKRIILRPGPEPVVTTGSTGSSSSSSCIRPMSVSLQQWQPSYQSYESEGDVEEKSKETQASSKNSFNLHLSMATEEGSEAPIGRGADSTNSHLPEKPEPSSSSSPRKSTPRLTRNSQRSSRAVSPTRVPPDSQVEVLEISSEVEKPASQEEDNFALHFSQSQTEASQYTIGLDTMTAAQEKQNDDHTEASKASPQEQNTAVSEASLPYEDSGKPGRQTPKSKRKRGGRGRGSPRTRASAPAPQPSLTLSMIDTETQETQDLGAQPIGFRIDRPSMDSQNMEDSVKEVSVFQRVRQEKEAPQAIKKRSSTGSSSDPFEFSEGLEIRDKVEFTSMQQRKDKELLEKRKGSTPKKSGRSGSGSGREDEDFLELGEDGDEDGNVEGIEDVQGSVSVYDQETEEHPPAEPVTTEESRVKGVVVLEERDQSQSLGKEAQAPGQGEGGQTRGQGERGQPKSQSQTQEYTTIRDKDLDMEAETVVCVPATAAVPDQSGNQDRPIETLAEKDTQIIQDNQADVSKSTPVKRGPAKRRPWSKKRKYRRTPARSQPPDSSDTTPPLKEKRPASEPADPRECRITQSQKDQLDLQRAQALQEQARQRKASYEKRPECTTLAAAHSRLPLVVSPQQDSLQPDVAHAPMVTPPTLQPKSEPPPQAPSQHTFRTIQMKTVFCRTITLLEELVNGQTIKTSVLSEKMETLNEDISHSEETVEDPSPSRQTSISLTSGDMADISSFSSGRSRSSIDKNSVERVYGRQISDLSKTSSSASAGSSHAPVAERVIGEIHIPGPHVDRSVYNLSLAARESIESPIRSRMSIFGDQSEQTFAQGISKRSSLLRPSIEPGEHVFTVPSTPLAQERKRRSSPRTRSGGEFHSLGSSDASSFSRQVVPETSVSHVSETSVATVPETVTGNTSEQTAPDTTTQEVVAEQLSTVQTKTGEQSSVMQNLVEQPSKVSEIDSDDMIPGTDLDITTEMSLPLTPKGKGKGRGKGKSPGKKSPAKRVPKKRKMGTISEENNNKEKEIRLAESNGTAEATATESTAMAGPTEAGPPPGPVLGPDPGPDLDISSLVRKPDTSATDLEMNELTVTPPETPTRPLEPGTRVLASWKDHHYYSGVVKSVMKPGMYKILFDDGNVKCNVESNLIVCKLLPIGHSVLAEKDDGWLESAVITGHYQEDQDVGYVVIFDNGTTARIPKFKVSLDPEQVRATMANPVPLPLEEGPVEPGNASTSPDPAAERTKPELTSPAVGEEPEVDDSHMTLEAKLLKPSGAEEEALQPSPKSSSSSDLPEFPLRPARVTPSRQPKKDVGTSYQPTIKPHVHVPSTPLEADTPVMALWHDKHYYPGKISKQETSGRFEICFEDGDVRCVTESEIIVCELLNIGQSVYAEKGENMYEPAMILDLYQKENEIGYLVEFDDGSKARVRRGKVTISQDQANALFGDCGPSSTPGGTKPFDISLDNLVSGKRHRPLGTPILTPRAASSPLVTETQERSANLLKALSSKKKDASSTKGKRGRPPTTQVQSSAAGDPEASTNKADSPAGSTKKKGKGRKRKASQTPAKTSKRRLLTEEATPTKEEELTKVLDESPKETTEEPSIDKSAAVEETVPSNLFAQMTFLLSYTARSEEQKKRERHLIRQQLLLTPSSQDQITDSDTSMEEEEEVPFDKSQLVEQIKKGGGAILDDVEEIASVKGSCFLISDTCHRTLKYFCALAAGYPCVSHVWIRDSCSMNLLQDYKNYILPAGFDAEGKKVVEWNAEHRPLQDLNVVLSSVNENFITTWTEVLQIAGCNLLKKLPTKASIQAGKCHVDVVVADKYIKAAVLAQASGLGVPVVSSEWIIQCLIHGHRLPFLSHPKFKHDHQPVP